MFAKNKEEDKIKTDDEIDSGGCAQEEDSFNEDKNQD